MEAALPLLLGRKKEELQGNQKVEIHSVEIKHTEGPKIKLTASKNYLKSFLYIQEAERKPFLFLFMSAICDV